jgi:hypothetical protein
VQIFRQFTKLDSHAFSARTALDAPDSTDMLHNSGKHLYFMLITYYGSGQ